MSRRLVLPILAALALSALFVRLGFWQLGRLGERRARNALVAARAALPPAPLSALPADTAQAHFRRVAVRGTYDFAREVAVTNRIRNGAPGVNLVTPLRTDDGRTVLVNRGWVYSPNGAEVDHSRWRDSAAASIEGYVETFPPPLVGQVRVGADSASVRWLSHADVERHLGAPVAPYYVVLLGDTTVKEGLPVRLTVPPKDEGPHKSYAMQWFSFATISVVGMGVWLAAETKRRPDRRRAAA